MFRLCNFLIKKWEDKREFMKKIKKKLFVPFFICMFEEIKRLTICYRPDEKHSRLVDDLF